MRTPLFEKTPDHRSRGLMNLVACAGRCAELPDVGEDERLSWRAEAQRAWAELQALAREQQAACMAAAAAAARDEVLARHPGWH